LLLRQAIILGHCSRDHVFGESESCPFLVRSESEHLAVGNESFPIFSYISNGLGRLYLLRN